MSRPRPGLRRRVLEQLAATATSIAVGVGAWYLTIVVFAMEPYVLPYPHDVAAEIWAESELFARHGWHTLKEILAGFVVASILGILIGMVLTFSRVIQRIFYPLLVFAQATPKVALAPLFLAWFGFTFKANLAITVLIAIFPVVVNTMLGLSSIDVNMLRLGRAMGASPVRLFWMIRLPIALPTILAGVRLAMAFAAIGAVIGEIVASTAGLGYLVQDASARLDTVRSIGAIVVISVMAVVLYYGVAALERVALRGHPRAEGADGLV
jgi:NitT/TauT family transport system permease protein